MSVNSALYNGHRTNFVTVGFQRPDFQVQHPSEQCLHLRIPFIYPRNLYSLRPRRSRLFGNRGRFLWEMVCDSRLYLRYLPHRVSAIPGGIILLVDSNCHAMQPFLRTQSPVVLNGVLVYPLLLSSSNVEHYHITSMLHTIFSC